MRRAAVLLVVALVGLLALTVPASSQEPVEPSDPVAMVGDTPISKGEFDRWLKSALRSVSNPGRPPGARARREARRDVMRFLVQAAWLHAEAAARGVKVAPRQIRRSFERQRRRAFPKPGGYRRFLRRTGATERDILFRIELELIQTRLAGLVVDGAERPTRADVDRYLARRVARFDRLPADRARRIARREISARRRTTRLQRFIEDFQTRSKAMTTCAEGYVVDECGGVLAPPPPE